LLIQITKRPDGGGVLRCVRQNGSVTWQKQKSRHAPFFALHDITHFTVESTLGFERGFFGLIAAGWDVEDTTGKGLRGPLPDQTAEVEYIVGSLDSERAGGGIWPADDFNQQAAIHAAAYGLPEPRRFTDEELARVRARRDELFARWSKVAPGETLELWFEPRGAKTAS
jgi:hypothetical protein